MNPAGAGGGEAGARDSEPRPASADPLETALAGLVPEGAEVVRARILRRVVRFTTRAGLRAYAKQHLFPFLRVRLRYALRPGPAAREARLLRAARARGLAVPAVLAARERRGLLGPRLSVLVTAELAGRPLAPGPESWPVRVAAVRALAGAGLFHPDLHPDNVLVLDGGGIGFVDLQSCRLRRGPLGRALHERMLAPLFAPEARALAGAEGRAFLAGSGLDPERLFARLRRLELRRIAARRRHALRSSTQVQRSGFLGRRLTRRGASVPAGPYRRRPAPAPAATRRLAVSIDPGGRVLRLAGGSALRRIWLRALVEPGPEDHRILAWERRFVPPFLWPWGAQALYISLPKGGSEVDRILECILAGGPPG